MKGSRADGCQRGRKHWVPTRLAAWEILIALLLMGIVSSGTIVTAGTCPPVQNTLRYTIVYGDVTVDGQPVAVGAVVEARNGDGVVAGCFEVTTAGSYGAMFVYGEDTSVDPPISGMREGEVIAFYVDGVEATATPQQTWSNDKASHPVNLSANSAPPAGTASLGLAPSSGSYDVGDEFDVNVILDAPDYLVAGIDVLLAFDPGKLQVVSFTEAALGSCTYLGQAVDNDAGTVGFSVIIPLSGGEGCLIYDHPQNMAVGTVRFHAGAGGTANVAFDFTPGDKNDSNVAVEGVADDMLGSVTNSSYGLCYDFNHNDEVDIGDLVIIAGAWRATDTESLADYNYNGNSKVDVGDIMTVAKHLGEPCP